MLCLSFVKVHFYKKADRAISCLNFYMLRQWRFISENSIRLFEQLPPADRATFYFDVREIDWKKYVTDYVLGTRKFILKDDLSSLPIARRNLRRSVLFPFPTHRNPSCLGNNQSSIISYYYIALFILYCT